MSFRKVTGLLSVALPALCLLASPASATSILVGNASFETLPASGLPNGCGLGCSYSDSDIPGWATISGSAGQFQPGSSSGNTTYFNALPDGLTVAYSNGGSLAQTVAATAVAGATYTLQVALGFRNELPDNATAALVINGNTVVATGTPAPFSGNFADYTASYTATAADAGSAISILLSSPGSQGDFDNVRLASNLAVPEASTWIMMLAGFGLMGVALRKRSLAGLRSA
jgi:hypothetical protein